MRRIHKSHEEANPFIRHGGEKNKYLKRIDCSNFPTEGDRRWNKKALT